MAEIIHTIYLSTDIKGTKGVVTVRPPLDRGPLADAKAALGVQQEETENWVGISAPGEARFVSPAVNEDALRLAGMVVCIALKANGLDAIYDLTQEVLATEKGFYPANVK